MMLFAGVISGLLGIGSGALPKVIAMDSIMRIPFKVSTTTSNFYDRGYCFGKRGGLPPAGAILVSNGLFYASGYRRIAWCT